MDPNVIALLAFVLDLFAFGWEAFKAVFAWLGAHPAVIVGGAAVCLLLVRLGVRNRWLAPRV